jgi:poly(beta-D-mannuronate) lyase
MQNRFSESKSTRLEAFMRRSSLLGHSVLLLTTSLLLPASSVLGQTTVGDVKAFNEAIKSAKPGATIVLAAGVWKDADLRIPATVVGTAEAPIRIVAETPGQTILSGTSRLRIGGRFVVVDGLAFRDFTDSGHIIQFRNDSDEPASDSTLTNVSIAKPLATDKDADVSSHWISVYGLRNRVTRCHVEGKRTSSPMLTVWVTTTGTPDEHVISRNFFAGRPPLGKNGGETIRVGTSDVSMNNSRTIVEENLFQNCDGESEIISNKSCENIYRRNTFLSSKGGLVLRHGNRCLVENNYFLGNNLEGTGGIRLIGEDHRIIGNHLQGLAGTNFESAFPICDAIPDSPLNGYFQVKRALVSRNTIVDCAQSMIFGVGTGARNRILPALDSAFESNLISSTHSPLIRVLNAPLNPTFTGNLFDGELGTDLPGFTKTTVTWQKDEHGILRPSQSLPAGTPNRAPPITRADVGPAWLK